MDQQTTKSSEKRVKREATAAVCCCVLFGGNQNGFKWSRTRPGSYRRRHRDTSERVRHVFTFKNKTRGPVPSPDLQSVSTRVVPSGDVSRFPENCPKISSGRPAWQPGPGCASAGGCSPPCPAWAARGTTPGSSDTPAHTEPEL